MKAASLSNVLRRIEDWKLKLIDLSRRNRLVNFTQSRNSSIVFEDPSINSIFNRLVVKDRYWDIYEPPDDPRGRIRKPRKTELVSSETDPKQFLRVLRNLERRSISEYRERGIRILYVAFGVLHWIDKTTNQELKSPLVLTPVELSRKSTRDPYRIEVPAVEDEAILNPALKLKLKYDHQIELPSLPDFENVSIYDFLLQIEKALHGTNWIVEHSINMGLFSFYKLVMYHDLDENANMIAEHPLISSLANISKPPKVKGSLPKEEDLDKIQDPRNTYQVLDADSSQQLCIQYALKGQSFVMHGPPGTGKSQTIANMIAEFIAAGKSILFVSEKMAALEVVYNRLKAQGLDDFCLELHSHKANKREVVSELKRSLDEHLKTRKGLTSEELERLKTRRNQLNSYVESLHKKRKPIDLSAYELFGRIAQLAEVPFFASQYKEFDKLNQKKLFELEELVRRLSFTWTVIEKGDTFPWMGCKEESFTPETRSQWMSLLESCLETIYSLKEETKRYVRILGLNMPKKIEDYERLDRLNKLIMTTPRPPIRWFEDIILSDIKTQSEVYLEEWEKYWATRYKLENNYDSRFLSMPPGTADRIQSDLTNVKKLLVLNGNEEGGLLEKRRDLYEYLSNLPELIDNWKNDAKKAMSLMELRGEVKTIERLRQIAELVKLCETSYRPERSWLDEWRLKEVKETLSKLKENITKIDKLKLELLDYSNEILKLNHDELILWFEGSGKSFLRYFMPRHYRYRNLIRSINKKRTVPEKIIEDLKKAKKLSSLLASIEVGRHSARRDLGIYYQNDIPDFSSAEKAIVIAEKAMSLSKRKRIPRALRDNLVADVTASKELLLIGNKLLGSVNDWLKKTRQLNDLIPSKNLPKINKSIQKGNLIDVLDWTQELKNALESLEKTSSEALATMKGKYPSSYNQLVRDIRNAEELQVFEDELIHRSSQIRSTYGGLYNGLLTDWRRILSAIDWSSRLLRTLPEGVPIILKNTISESDVALPVDPKISTRLKNIINYMTEINEKFDYPIWSTPKSTDLDLVETNVLKLKKNIDELQTWVDFNKLHGEIVNVGLGGLLNQMKKRQSSRENLVSILRKALYQGLLDQIFIEDPKLKAFRGQDHEQLISDFQKLDRKFIQLNSQRVISKANKQKPQGVFVQAPDSEITVLMREAAKKRRHMPLRELFERIPILIRKLKPCLMMSPISVSQFLKPKGIHFDLVVFDEASQIYTEDAVGAIYRGDQLVIAGDPKQLPPTPFFQYTIDDEFDWDSDYEFDVFDSVLDECMGIGLPVKMLRWHYRSRHDSLISFSNDRFYDGQLVLFPASRMGANDLGLEFVYVKDGLYDRGKTRNNIKEAEVVANLVFEHFTKYPDKTLGVVTFSISQMNTVQDAVESRLRDHPEFEPFFKEDRLNGFFVKNLENVQGDERDVMIFSVGYGYDESGKITMNFGPLNKIGGERRLNVAITRAREKVVLVSSIRYDDIKLTSTQAQGVHSLHHYLQYAEGRPKNLGEDVINKIYLSSLEADVLEEVQRLGYKANPKVGSSSFHVDIGVLDPEDPTRFLMGIMCDGETYQDANTARDRDRLRFQVLENLGWRIHRIWSPDWVQRRDSELKRLEKSVNQAEHEGSKVISRTLPTPENPLDKKIEKVKVEEAKSNDLPEVEPYRFSNPRPRHLFSRYSSEHRERYLKQYHTEVYRLLPGVVKYEGPIHLDQAYNRLNKAFRLGRATKVFREAYMEEIEKLTKNKIIKLEGVFLWPLRNEPIRVRVPVEGVRESFRLIEQIATEEIEKAMIIVACHSFQGISPENLYLETAKLLGFRRIGSNIKLTLDKVYSNLHNSNKLIEENGQIHPND